MKNLSLFMIVLGGMLIGFLIGSAVNKNCVPPGTLDPQCSPLDPNCRVCD